ncbi:MAG: hypothetical protein MZV64_72955 [Ignavibacteriales bacterium]|nr:hypothetical protein [Ignavibacteriales bacterium]
MILVLLRPHGMGAGGVRDGGDHRRARRPDRAMDRHSGPPSARSSTRWPTSCCW